MESASPAVSSGHREPMLIKMVSLSSSSHGGESPSGLQRDFYHKTCPEAEVIIRSEMAVLYNLNHNLTTQLLRLFFTDCLSKGCDASNEALKVIELVKLVLEKVCPGVVSCGDIVALVTRESVVLAGGSFYPLDTGRRDTTELCWDKRIPKFDDNIRETLNVLSQRGFNDLETVVLLGGLNIGGMGCEFINARLNKKETGQPDPTLPPLLTNIILNCTDAVDMEDISARQKFMADEKTVELVRLLSVDDGSYFQWALSRALTKMSVLNVVTGYEGEVKLRCSKMIDKSRVLSHGEHLGTNIEFKTTGDGNMGVGPPWLNFTVVILIVFISLMISYTAYLWYAYKQQKDIDSFFLYCTPYCLQSFKLVIPETIKGQKTTQEGGGSGTKVSVTSPPSRVAARRSRSGRSRRIGSDDLNEFDLT